jgi:hypothetical protein
MRLMVEFDQPMDTVPVEASNWVWQLGGGFNWVGSSFVMWRTATSLWLDGFEGVVPSDDSLASYLATVPDVRSAALVECEQTLNYPIG